MREKRALGGRAEAGRLPGCMWREAFPCKGPGSHTTGNRSPAGQEEAGRGRPRQGEGARALINMYGGQREGPQSPGPANHSTTCEGQRLAEETVMWPRARSIQCPHHAHGHVPARSVSPRREACCGGVLPANGPAPERQALATSVCSLHFSAFGRLFTRNTLTGRETIGAILKTNKGNPFFPSRPWPPGQS